MSYSITLLGLAVLVAASGAPRAEDVDHAAVAQRAAEELALPPATRSEWTLDQVLDEQRFVSLPVGAFELLVRRAELADERRVEAFQELCTALLDVQGAWRGWQGEPDARGVSGKQLEKDRKEAERWIAKWKPKQLAQLADDAGQDLFEATRAKDSTRESVERLRTALAPDPGGEGGAGAPVRMVLLSDRARFFEMLCLAGELRPDQRAALWVDGAHQWTNFTVDSTLFVALEFAAVGAPAADYARGTSMNAATPTGMQQQVAHLALQQLFDRAYGDVLPPELAAGLTLELLIDVFGEANTRVDGDLVGNETSARSVFVPGGRSEGGLLPKNSAESRWREKQGSEHFLGVLRQSQRDGASEAGASRSVRHFLLRSEDERRRYALLAPVFAIPEEGTDPVPAEVLGDYAEFLRAYRSGFLFWLRTEGGGSKKRSGERFTELLRRIADPSEQGDLGEAFRATYEAPLSDPTAGEDSLEGRFLEWLSKRR